MREAAALCACVCVCVYIYVCVCVCEREREREKKRRERGRETMKRDLKIFHFLCKTPLSLLLLSPSPSLSRISLAIHRRTPAIVSNVSSRPPRCFLSSLWLFRLVSPCGTQSRTLFSFAFPSPLGARPATLRASHATADAASVGTAVASALRLCHPPPSFRAVLVGLFSAPSASTAVPCSC